MESLIHSLMNVYVGELVDLHLFVHMEFYLNQLLLKLHVLHLSLSLSLSRWIDWSF